MFQLQTMNELSCMAQGDSIMYAKKGTMVAYQGDFTFEKLIIGPGKNLASAIIGNVVRRFTGEYMELMKVSGQGSCYFADFAQHVTVINLQQGDSIGVESENLLAFTDGCEYGVRPIGVGIISQKGLFTSKITAKTSGGQVAVLSDGNPIVLQTPCFVDPDAVICWEGKDPKFKLGLNWKNIIGQASGESYMLEFVEPGYTVIVQPSERGGSGVKLGLDDKKFTPRMQGSAFNNTQQNVSNVMGSSQSASSGGFANNLLGNILKGRF